MQKGDLVRFGFKKKSGGSRGGRTAPRKGVGERFFGYFFLKKSGEIDGRSPPRGGVGGGRSSPPCHRVRF